MGMEILNNEYFKEAPSGKREEAESDLNLLFS